MKSRQLFARTTVLCLALCAACSKSNGGSQTGSDPLPRVVAPDLGPGEVVAEGSIGPEGGVLSAGLLRLEVPANAFAASATLIVSRHPEASLMRDQRAGEVYVVDGLPESFASPLTVELPTAPGADTVYLRDNTGFTPSYGEASVLVGLALETVAAEGALRATIPAAPDAPQAGQASAALKAAGSDPREAPGTGGLAALAQEPATSTSSVALWLSAATLYVDSPSGKFRVRYSSGTAGERAAAELASSLDASYQLLEGLGLSWSKRTAWPIQVNLFPFSSEQADRFGQEEPSVLGINHHSLSFNLARFSTPTDWTELRVTAGHELFHLLQFLYDPRNRLAQAKLAGAWLWMDEATATWFETLLNPAPDFIPATARDSYDFLTEALETNTQDHGYGAAFFLRFLTHHGGSNQLIGELVASKATASTRPVDALARVAPSDLGVSWSLFAQKYMAGELYATKFPTTTEIVSLATGRKYVFQDATSEGTSFTWSAPDLSARFFKLDFAHRYPEPTLVRVALVDAAQGADAVLYKVKSGVWEKVGTATASAPFVGDARALAENDESLIVMVANGRAEAPYTGSVPLELVVGREAPAITGSMKITPPDGWTGTIDDYAARRFSATLSLNGSTDGRIFWEYVFVSKNRTAYASIKEDLSADPNGGVIDFYAPACGSGCEMVIDLRAYARANRAIADTIRLNVLYK